MKKVLSSAVVLILTLAMLTGCSNSGKVEEQGAEGDIIVQYLNGEEVLETVKVNSGDVLEEYIPTVEGKEFTGWFATPGLTHKFDTTAPITADVSIFGGFVAYQKDTRDFFMLGSGTSPDLKDSNWGNGTNVQLEAKHTDTENIYTITTDLYVGDEFQFAINSSWHVKRGAGYLVATDSSAEECFNSAGGLGDTSTRGANINVAKDGNYTFTLKTYPSEDYYDIEAGGYTEEAKDSYIYNNFDVIEWTRNGDVEGEKIEAYNVYYLKGEQITAWQDLYAPSVKMDKGDADMHTLTIFLKENDQFLFTSQVVIDGKETGVGTVYVKGADIADDSTALLEANDGGNIVALETGIYSFTYNEAEHRLSATCEIGAQPEEREFYVTGLEKKDDQFDWSVLNADKKLVPVGDGMYELATLEVEADAQFKVQAVSVGAESVTWDEDGTAKGDYNHQYKGVSGDANADFVAADLTGEWPNHNVKAVKAGTYEVVYNSYTNMIDFYAQ